MSACAPVLPPPPRTTRSESTPAQSSPRCQKTGGTRTGCGACTALQSGTRAAPTAASRPRPRRHRDAAAVAQRGASPPPRPPCVADNCCCSQMFGYLARMYENCMAHGKQQVRAEQLVRRGAEILAAVRLLAGLPRNRGSEYPAGGTEARNPSWVSVWGWRPHREEALAERVSERRRLRAAEMRAKAREEKTLRRRGIPRDWTPRVAVYEGVSSKRPPMSWAELELEKSRRRRQRSAERMQEPLALTVAVNVSRAVGGDASVSSPEGMKLPAVRRRRETINWHFPDYHDGYDIPELKLPDSLEGGFTTASVASGGDTFLRSQTIRTPSKLIQTPYYVANPISEPVSPKTQPKDPIIPNTVLPKPLLVPMNTPPVGHTAGEPTPESPSTVGPSTYPTTDSDSHHLHPVQEQSSATTEYSQTFGTRFSRSSSGVKSFKLQKVRAAIKSVFPTVSKLPWSSGSQTSDSASITQYGASPPQTRGLLRGLAVPWTSRLNAVRTSKTAGETKKSVSEILLISNRTTTSERVPAPVPTPAPVPAKSGDDETLTRTEKEYQEILETLQTLKREMRMEREAMRSERRRSKSRGRRMERMPRRSRERSRERSQSRETLRWWLEDVV